MSTSKLSTRQIFGYAIARENGVLEPIEFELKPVGPYDLRVKISHCGICHSDLHLIENDWKVTTYPLIPGHEIVGEILEKGALVKGFEIGGRVGIGWQEGSCGTCSFCHQGEENLCLEQKATCLGRPGGFAEEIIADSRFAFPIPAGLRSEIAAPLLCGGATVFSPLLQHKVAPTWKVGVVGIGGLGHLALQFLRALGCEVFAFSSSKRKEESAKAFGAHHFFSSTHPADLKQAAHTLDFLLCTSSGSLDYGALLQLLRPKGIFCHVGIPKGGQIDLSIGALIAGRKTVCGSNIASPLEINQMLSFAALHNIGAEIELFPMHEANRALEKLAANKIHYRAVLYNL